MICLIFRYDTKAACGDIENPRTVLEQISAYQDQLKTSLTIGEDNIDKYTRVADLHRHPAPGHRYLSFELICAQPDCTSFHSLKEPKQTAAEHLKSKPSHMRLRNVQMSPKGEGAYDVTTCGIYQDMIDKHTEHNVVMRQSHAHLAELRAKIERSLRDDSTSGTMSGGASSVPMSFAFDSHISTVPIAIESDEHQNGEQVDVASLNDSESHHSDSDSDLTESQLRAKALASQRHPQEGNGAAAM